MLARIIILLVAAALALPVDTGDHPAHAGKKFKTVTRTFASNSQIAVPGPDPQGRALPYPATLQVGGFKKGKIKDVNLTLRQISHTFPDDIDVLLVAPGGRNATVLSDVGGSEDAEDVTVTLDDQAAQSLPNDPSPFVSLPSGTFRPTNFGPGDNFLAPSPLPSGNVALSTFNGSNPNGQWRLFVMDDFVAGGDGSIAGGWMLEIKAKVKKKKKKTS